MSGLCIEYSYFLSKFCVKKMSPLILCWKRGGGLSMKFGKEIRIISAQTQKSRCLLLGIDCIRTASPQCLYIGTKYFSHDKALKIKAKYSNLFYSYHGIFAAVIQFYPAPSNENVAVLKYRGYHKSTT